MRKIKEQGENKEIMIRKGESSMKKGIINRLKGGWYIAGLFMFLGVGGYLVVTEGKIYSNPTGKQKAVKEIKESKENKRVQSDRQALQTALSVQRAIRNVAKSVTPSVVNIRTEKTVRQDRLQPNPFFDFFRDYFRDYNRGPKKLRSLGSGFVLSKEGYIVTNNHVINDADEITIVFPDEKEYKGKVVGIDKRTDIAVIKINPKSRHNIPVTPLGNSDKVDIGDFAIAIGNPFGLKGTFTLGVISARGRDNIDQDAGLKNYIQTDASINQGNSGGPLLNIEGQAIGMNTSIYSTTGGSVGIGFAIPINIVKSIVVHLIEKGSISRGFLGVGISSIPDDVAKHFGIDKRTGIFIQQVEEGGPASKGGIKAGDIILKLNGQKITSTSKLQRLVSSYPEGTRVALDILRNGKQQKKYVTLGSMGSRDAIARGGDRRRPSGKSKGEKGKAFLGITVGSVEDNYKYFRLNRGTKGVVILGVKESSEAYKSGLRVGDLIKSINFNEIKTVKDFWGFVGRRSKGVKSFLINVIRGGRSSFVVVKR